MQCLVAAFGKPQYEACATVAGMEFKFGVEITTQVGMRQMMTLLMNTSLRMKPASVHLAQTKFTTVTEIVVQSTIAPLSAVKVQTLAVSREVLGVLNFGNVTHAAN